MIQRRSLQHVLAAASLSLIACAVSAADYAYIPNSNSRTISVINTATGELATTLSPASMDATLNDNIYTLALRPGANNESWFGQYRSNNKLGVIDTTNNSLKAVIDNTGSSVSITFSANGAIAYVSDYVNSKLHIIDANSKQITASLNTGCWTISSALSQDGASLYVRCGDTGEIKKLDTATNTLSTLENVSNSGFGLAYDPTGAGKLYTSSNAGNTVGLIDLADNTVTQITISGINGPAKAVAVRKNGSKLYVGGNNNVLHVVDTANTSTQKTLTLSGEVSGITGLGISANDAALYAVTANGTVHVIDVATDTETKTISAAAGASSLWIWGDFLGNVVASATPGGPSVASIAPQGTPSASATSINFAVTFSEAVNGVDGTDFALTTTGTATGTMGTPSSADNGITWTVPVTAISGTGSLRLDLNSSGTGIESTAAAKPIAGGFATGTVHNVDVQVPVAGACGTAAGQATALAPAAGLCSAGTATAISSASGKYTWQCQGLNGGSANSCEAPWSTAGGSKAMVALQTANGWQVSNASFSTTPPATAPQGVTFPSGLLSLNLSSGNLGSDATVTLNFSTPVPAGAVYMKYGPSPDGFNCQGAACAQPHWYQLPANRAVLASDRLSATLTLTDGGLGDNDGIANQSIQDPGGFALLVAPASTAAIPTLSEWGIIALSSLLAMFGIARMRRRQG
ncbi:IPTL-CTERM sorting domain-containing protein [Delftia tsuruhatensis]|uniref:IPTL-CTERM sorting domain-containing protein n=1 Tax=Delftia tsuruhatensis TaxID=180282 RepID=UPI0020917A39|nr:IPTL-CTERM sorting domain-containing protein [Delftia tsuruhatensis]MCO5339638.1 IPTL-CTERM sorting domain-containing protein [Delftia tsuruhatensis]MCR4547256.1 IPTL-CTERM sorting domain-containing protein [Delftia tsuruhatensis]